MTLQAVPHFVRHVIAAGAASKPFDFTVAAAAHVRVRYITALNPSPAWLVFGVDFTVQLNAGGVGGTVTFTPALTGAGTIEIERATPRTQARQFRNLTRLPEEAIEGGFDAGAMMAQELDERLSRAFIVPRGEVAGDMEAVALIVADAAFAIAGKLDIAAFNATLSQAVVDAKVPVFDDWMSTGKPGLYTPNGLRIGRGIYSGAEDQFELHVVRNADYTGGDGGAVSGFCNSALLIATNVAASARANEWPLIVVLRNEATALGVPEDPQNSATYFQAHKFSSGWTWAATIETIDYNANPISGTIGLELDMSCNGADNNNTRVGIDLWARPVPTTVGAPASGTVRYGLRFNAGAEAGATTTLVDAIYFNNTAGGAITYALRDSGGNFSLSMAGAFTAKGVTVGADGLAISSVLPAFTLEETDQAADGRLWALPWIQGGVAAYGPLSDALVHTVAFTIPRTGVTNFALAPTYTNAPDARSKLGLGTAATRNTGTSGTSIPLLNAANAWSAAQTFATDTLCVVDSAFSASLAASIARWTFHTGDYFQYDRTNNEWGFYIASAAKLLIGSTGFTASYNHFIPNPDNSLSLGASSFRWTVVYATTGTINTSDANEKTALIQAGPEAYRAVARAFSAAGMFKWRDAVEKKGDAARLHFGLTAQGVEQAFMDEGLDPARYALFCADTFEQGEGDDVRTVTRKGLRYDQVHTLAIADIYRRVEALEQAA